MTPEAQAYQMALDEQREKLAQFMLVSLGTYVDGLRESLGRLLEAVERK